MTPSRLAGFLRGAADALEPRAWLTTAQSVPVMTMVVVDVLDVDLGVANRVP